MPPLFSAMFTAIRGALALWVQTEVQVNLNLGLTSRSLILEVFYEVYNELGFGFLESAVIPGHLSVTHSGSPILTVRS